MKPPSKRGALAAQMQAHQPTQEGNMNRQFNDVEYIWKSPAAGIGYWDGGARGGRVIPTEPNVFVAESEGGRQTAHVTFDFAAGVAQYRNAERFRACLRFIEAYGLGQ